METWNLRFHESKQVWGIIQSTLMDTSAIPVTSLIYSGEIINPQIIYSSLSSS